MCVDDAVDVDGASEVKVVSMEVISAVPMVGAKTFPTPSLRDGIHASSTCLSTSRMMPSRGNKLALAILVICLACSVIAKVAPEKQTNLSALGTHEIEEQLQVHP